MHSYAIGCIVITLMGLIVVTGILYFIDKNKLEWILSEKTEDKDFLKLTGGYWVYNDMYNDA
jgi:hypothetical protein